MYVNEKLLSKIMGIALKIILVTGAIVTISLPVSLKTLFPLTFAGNDNFYRFMLMILSVSGVMALCIMFQIIKVLKTVENNTPFVYSNARSLNIVSVCCFVIAGFNVLKCAIYPTMYTFVITAVFVIAGFLSLICAALFKQATDVKNENDLTI